MEKQDDIQEEPNNEIVAVNSDILKSLGAKKFDISQFHEKFENRSEEALYALLNLQDNKNPLKKGGEGVAFRCDTFILKNRQKYNTAENTVFDIISGWVSSHPEDKHYTIYARDVKQYTPYSDSSYVYKVLKNGVNGLKTKPLEFEYTDEKGRTRIIDTPWYKLLSYDKDENSDSPCIMFTPTSLFKTLLLSATITHGAFYLISVATQIQAPQPRTLYYYLESKKNYREYPGATPGKFKLSLDELREVVGYSDKYEWADINSKVLSKTKTILEEIEGATFTLDYKPIKDYIPGSVKKVTVGVEITITTIGSRNKIERIEEKSISEDDYIAERAIINSQGITEEKDIQRILKAYATNNRDIGFLTNTIVKMATIKNIKSKPGLICWFMENGLDKEYIESKSETENQKTEPKKNSFKNFPERTYDYDDLERKLLQVNSEYGD